MEPMMKEQKKTFELSSFSLEPTENQRMTKDSRQYVNGLNRAFKKLCMLFEEF